MMNTLRVWRRTRAWEGRYRAHLLEVGSDPVARIKVHAKNLAEYCSRWLGACGVAFTTPEALVRSDLFVVLRSASKVAAEDVAKLTQGSHVSIEKSWQTYWQHLQEIKSCPPNLKEQAEVLEKTLGEFIKSVERV